jgi:hypothetical protein
VAASFECALRLLLQQQQFLDLCLGLPTRRPFFSQLRLQLSDSILQLLILHFEYFAKGAAIDFTQCFLNHVPNVSRASDVWTDDDVLVPDLRRAFLRLLSGSEWMMFIMVLFLEGLDAIPGQQSLYLAIRNILPKEVSSTGKGIGVPVTSSSSLSLSSLPKSA